MTPAAIKSVLLSTLTAAMVGVVGYALVEIKEQGEKAAKLEEAALHFKQGYMSLLEFTQAQNENLVTTRSDVAVLKSRLMAAERRIEQISGEHSK